MVKWHSKPLQASHSASLLCKSCAVVHTTDTRYLCMEQCELAITYMTEAGQATSISTWASNRAKPATSQASNAPQYPQIQMHNEPLATSSAYLYDGGAYVLSQPNCFPTCMCSGAVLTTRTADPYGRCMYTSAFELLLQPLLPINK
jgi:hypothetical protein